MVLRQPVEIYREAHHAGQNAVFLVREQTGAVPFGTVQRKHTSDAAKSLRPSDLTPDIGYVEELVKAGTLGFVPPDGALK